MGVSICVYITNRAHLFKYNLESIARQNYDKDKIEMCVLDEGSTDNLTAIMDRYSEDFTFKFAELDRRESYIPCINPAAGLNALLRYMPSNDFVIKTDPEVIFKDPWIISEIVAGLEEDDTRMYNSRCHFTEPDGWWNNYEDITSQYQKHYHFAEGGPFSRAKFYFCSGFSQKKFIDLGGIDELMCLGKGYDDTLLREMWKNHYGQYEKEITGETIHLFHGHPQFRPTWEIANSRTFDRLKHLSQANALRINAEGRLSARVVDEPQWANPKMLSKIYTIKNGSIIDTKDINDGQSKSLDLPF